MLFFFLLILCIYPVSTTITAWQKLYNCNFMTATVFPINKRALGYGPKHHKLWGKWWEDAQAQLPSYNKKIQQTWLFASLTTPQNPEAAKEAYFQLRDQIYLRQGVPQTQVAPTEFEEKIRLMVFAGILGYDFVAESFPFINFHSPIYWLNPDFKLFFNWDNLLIKYYEKAAQLRLIKADFFDKDYCSELANSIEQSPADWAAGKAKDAFKLVFRCFDTFPHSSEAVNEILSGALMLGEMFVFSNISAPIIGSKKFFGFLKDQQVVYDSNFRWHDLLFKSINAFKDAHVSVKTDCYDTFTYIQPMFLQKILNDEVERLIITKVSSDDLKDWVNAEVLSIDGGEVEYFINSYATMTGKCHDSRARSAFVLSRKQWGGQNFVLERGYFLKRTALPIRPFLVYTLKRPGSKYIYEVKVDWMIFKGSILKVFSDQYSYWEKNCAAKPFVRKQALPPPPALSKRTIISKDLSSHDTTSLSLTKRELLCRPTNEDITPVAIGPGFAFFILVNDNLGTYAVLVIQSFEIDDIEGWFKGMRAGFQKLIQEGIKNLLLDLSGNTGGLLCLAYSLIGVLSPSPTDPFPATKYAYGTRVNPSKMLKTFSKCVDEANIIGSPFKLQTFKNLTCNCDFAPNVEWDAKPDNVIDIVNGFFQSYSTYSTFLVDRCDLKFLPLLADIKTDFENIIILTDGVCGSSCAIVSLYFQQNGSPGIAISYGYSQALMRMDDITTVYPLSLFAFAGGQVVTFDNVKDVARRSSCYDMLPKMLERFQITFTYRAIFNIEDKKNPLEYYLFPASATIPYNDEFTSSISARWKYAFPLGIDVLKNPDNYLRFGKGILTASTRYSYADMNYI